jgi:hypothetical protein
MLAIKNGSDVTTCRRCHAVPAVQAVQEEGNLMGTPELDPARQLMMQGCLRAAPRTDCVPAVSLASRAATELLHASQP